jgi:hypothetical protein
MMLDGGLNWAITVPSGMKGDAFWEVTTTVLVIKALAERFCKQTHNFLHPTVQIAIDNVYL